MTDEHKELKFLHCPICRNQARVAEVELVKIDTTHPDEPWSSTVMVHIECMSCSDHIGSTVELPLEVIGDYDLPEIGSNIYNPLKIELKKRSKDDQ